jgi:hypothetical protein
MHFKIIVCVWERERQRERESKRIKLPMKLWTSSRFLREIGMMGATGVCKIDR